MIPIVAARYASVRPDCPPSRATALRRPGPLPSSEPILPAIDPNAAPAPSAPAAPPPRPAPPPRRRADIARARPERGARDQRAAGPADQAGPLLPPDDGERAAQL